MCTTWSCAWSLRGLRPSTARQLYKATVAPVASPIWSMNLLGKLVRLAERVQRIGAIAIIGGFKSIALPVAESEASLAPVAQRWTTQRRRFWIDLHTLPASNPFWKVRQRTQRTQQRHQSVLDRMSKALKDVDLWNLERIQPFCLAPWQTRPQACIEERE